MTKTKTIIGFGASNRKRRAEVVEQFCKISAVVAKYFKNQYTADCFCSKRRQHHFQFVYEDVVLDFIETAVQEKIAREGPPASRFKEFSFGE